MKLARTHLGSAPASSNIPMTPCFAAGLSNLTARCNGVAFSRRFCKSTSVSSKSSRSESASGEGVAALRGRWRRLLSSAFGLRLVKGIGRQGIRTLGLTRNAALKELRELSEKTARRECQRAVRPPQVGPELGGVP